MSAPLPGAIGSFDQGTAFALSYSEAFFFCSRGRGTDPNKSNDKTTYEDATDEAIANYDATGNIKDAFVALRSTSPGTTYNQTYILNGGYNGRALTSYLNSSVAMPAMWINTTEADKLGLLVAR